MRLRLVMALLAALTVVSAVRGTPTGALPPAPPSAARSERALQRLTVAAASSTAGYSRDKFSDDWASVGNGCDVRERVLQRDGRDVRTGTDCKIVSGRWRSIYDAKVLRSSRSVDIDHVVPLANAWRSGARRWSATRREHFANDLRDPQLVAVSASSNRAKGDSAPEEWKPPRRAVWCLYARWWIDVKTTWRLTVTTREQQALHTMLATCAPT